MKYERLLQNFSFATATAEKRSFTARRAKNCKSLCKSNRLLQQAHEVELYEKLGGKAPVLDFILSLNPKEQAKIYREIDLLEKFGNELHFPHIRKIAGKKYSPLWELRIETTGNAFRIFYFMFDQNRSILLHGIKKKADKTPPKDLETALERMKDYLQRN